MLAFTHEFKTGHTLKSLLFITLLIGIPFIVSGQALTLDELLKIQESDFVDVNDLLTSKGWEFSHSEGGKSLQKGTVTWALEKNASGEASSWLRLSTTESYGNNVSYEMYNSKIYNSIKSRMTVHNMKVVENFVMDNEIVSFYQGKKQTVRVSIRSSKEQSFPRYTIDVMTNDFYSIMMTLFKGILQNAKDSLARDTTHIK